jgi:hypothetical protein
MQMSALKLIILLTTCLVAALSSAVAQVPETEKLPLELPPPKGSRRPPVATPPAAPATSSTPAATPSRTPAPGPTPTPSVTPAPMPVPSGTRPATSDARPQFVYYQGVDFYGDDLSSFLPDYSLGSCAEACRGQDACRAFTFNIAKNACMLKSGYGRIVNDPNAVSAAVQDGRSKLPSAPNPQLDIKIGVDYPGGDLYDRRPLSLDQCQTLCMSETKCVAFSYVGSKNWCWLKSTLTPPRRQPDVVSGTKL